MRLPAKGISDSFNRQTTDNSPIAHVSWRRSYKLAASAIAIAASFGWANKADAFGECGSPSGDTVHCNASTYSSGIEYNVDDLTVVIGDTNSVSVGNGNSGGVYSYGRYSEIVKAGLGNSSVSINSGYNNGIHAYAYDQFQETNVSAIAEIDSRATVNTHAIGLYAHSYAVEGDGETARSVSTYSEVINRSRVITSGGEGGSGDALKSKAYSKLYNASGYTRVDGSAIAMIVNTGYAYSQDGVGAHADATTNIYGSGGSFGYAGNATNPIETRVGVYNVDTAGPLPFQVADGNHTSPAIVSGGDDAVYAHVSATIDEPNGGNSRTDLVITNAADGTIASYGSGFNAIDFNSFNSVTADGGEGHAVAKSYGTITNRGHVLSATDDAIFGCMTAEARNENTFPGSNQDAVASSTMTVFNSGNITGDSAGINITNIANAYASHGNATATSSLTVANAQGGVIHGGTEGYEGIDVHSTAYANAYSTYHAVATANITIQNSGSIYGYGNAITARSDGNATATTFAQAYANTVFGNYVNGNLSTVGTLTGEHNDGADLYAYSNARVSGNSSIATADSSVYAHNDDTIVSGNDGLHIGSYSTAYASFRANSTASATSSVDVLNTGSITTALWGNPEETHNYHADGIVAYSYAKADQVSFATAEASVTISNSGAIHTDQALGTRADGIYSFSEAYAFGEESASATASALIINHGAITELGNNSFGINSYIYAHAHIADSESVLASVANANNSVLNYASISAVHEGIQTYAGANAEGASGGSVARAFANTFVQNSGSITVTGNGSIGIDAYGNASASSTPYAVANSQSIVTNSGNITAGLVGGNITGNASDGIHALAVSFAEGDDSADASAIAAIYNSGQVKVFGDYARGLFAKGYAFAYSRSGTASVELGSADGGEGAKALIVNSATIKTYGYESPAIRAIADARAYGAFAYANAYANVTNSGTLSTVGKYSPGVFASAVAYASDERLIDPRGHASSIVVNTGGIVTLGDFSPGVFNVAGVGAGAFGAEGGVSADAYTYTKNTASITTGNGNGTTGSYSPAILTASAAVANLPEGNFSNVFGLSGFGLGGIAGGRVGDVINNDQFSFNVDRFQGTGSYAAAATAVANISNSGTLTTHADFSPGILGLAVAYAYGTGNATVTNANVTIANSGNIVTFGCFSIGIAALAGAVGNGAYSDGSGSVNTATISVTNTANITTTGRYAFGIFAVATAKTSNSEFDDARGTATIHITNSGNVSATGIGADGIFAAALGYTSSNITMNLTGGSVMGGVAAEGGLFGLNQTLRHGNHVKTNQLQFFVYGGMGVEAIADNGPIDVENSGRIGALSDYAVSLFSNNGNVTLNNKSGGTIVGLVDLYGTNATFDNKGTWVVRGVGAPSSVRPSDVGNFSTNVYGFSTIYGFGEGGNGILINETGAKMLIVGNQEIDVGTFTNMGLVSLAERDTGAYETGPGAGQFEKLVIGGDYISNGGRIALDVDLETGQHDFVRIAGSARGNTDVEVVPGGGTPHATTGDGIPLIQVDGAINAGVQTAASGNAPADAFQLVGNTSNANDHKLIAGIFEYDLNLIPGNVTGGTWYLQSHPVFDFANINAGALTAFGMSSISFGDLLSNIPMSEIQGAENENGDYPKIASSDPGFIPGRPTEIGHIGVWGRFIGQSLDVSPGNSPAPFNVQMGLGQMGVDYALRTENGGALVLGAFAGYADASLDFDSSTANASVRGGVYGAYGLFVTGKWEAGILASIGDTSLHYNNPATGTHFGVTPSAYGLSGMLSRRIDLDNGLFFQPRVEYTFAHTGGFDFDSLGTNVDVGATESSIGLLGVRAGKSFDGGNGAMFAPYIDLAIENEFAGSTTVSGSGISLSTTLNGVDEKIGGGLNVLLNNKISLFARVDYVTGDVLRGVKGFAGVRFIAQ